MNVELINCEVCGHIVATDANCCPQCNSPSFKDKWETQKKKSRLDQLHAYKQALCNSVQEELKKRGKLYRGGIDIIGDGSFTRASHSLYSPRGSRIFEFLIDGKCISPLIGDPEFPTDNLSIIPYGTHKLSLYENGRELHTLSFEAVPNENNFISAWASIQIERHDGFWGLKYKVTFKGFTVKAESIDLYTLNEERFAFVCERLGIKPDWCGLQYDRVWDILSEERRNGIR